MLWSSFRFLGQTSLYIATTSTMRPATTLMMSKAFYYFHIMTTAQSAYSRSYNKFSRYFCFKVIFNMLFYHNIVFCFQQKYMVICFCFLCFFVSKKPFSIMCDWVKNNTPFIQRPNITINSCGCYTQVFFITTTCL